MTDNANEVSDKSIMASTNVERQDSSGRIRFTTVLPDGEPLSSEWIQESDKTKGVLLWCGAVRQAITSRAEEEEAQRKRRAQAARAARPKSLVDSSGAPIVQPTSTLISHLPTASTVSPTYAGGSSMSPSAAADPAVFVNSMLAQAEAQAARWEAEAHRAAKEWRKASEDLQKWRVLRDSLAPYTATTPTIAPARSAGVSSEILGPGITETPFSDEEEDSQ